MNMKSDFSANLTRYKCHRMTLNKTIYSEAETEFEMIYVVVCESWVAVWIIASSRKPASVFKCGI